MARDATMLLEGADTGGSQSAPTHFQVFMEEIPTTCDRCRSYDGKIVPIEQYERGKTAPPYHPNCRCRVELLNTSGNILY